MNDNNIDAEAQAVMNEILTLVENDIPECQQTLKDNHKNLERVAEYCDTNYFRSHNKSEALEETKSYTTQSLASVAYQIASLAFNVLHLLDFQVNQISSLESKINHLSQADAIHAEKVARREIGLFAANKKPVRFNKIVAPAIPERPMKYVRRPIDYSLYDDIGHGVKIVPNPASQIQSVMHTSRTKSVSSAQSINGGSSVYAPSVSLSGNSGLNIQAPNTKPPTPPQSIRSIGSLSRSSKEYRNPAISIAPPQVPNNYAPGNNLDATYMPTNTLKQNQSLYQETTQQQRNQYQAAQNDMSNLVKQFAQSSNPVRQQLAEQANLPLYDAYNIYGTGTIRYGQQPTAMQPPPTFNRTPNEPDWVPKNYIEKVIALYDYTKEKPDELNLCENAIIYVTKKNEDGWFEGVLDGQEGLFPCNYVEPIDNI